MNTGYAEAIRLAQENLRGLNLERVCVLSGAVFQGGDPLIPWFGENRSLESAKPAEKILWLHYLCSQAQPANTGKLIAFRELPSAKFYEPKFFERAENPLAKRFGSCPERLLQAGAKLGGTTADYGDYAVTLPMLPNIPVTYIVWGKDEEFGAQAKILFDSSAPRYLPTEDLTVLASLGVYKLIEGLA